MTLLIFAIMSSSVMMIGTFWYIYLVIKADGKVSPILATWIILASTMTLAFATYWTSPKHSLIGNVGNATGVVSTISILSTVVLVSLKRGIKLAFSEFQKWCLKVAGVIALFWVVLVWGFGGTGVIPNVLTQILMLVGYVATGERLMKANRNTEPFFFWTCIMLSGAFAIIVAVKKTDPLAYIYAIRATVTTAVLLVLMYQAGRKSKTALRTQVQFE